MTVRGPSAPLVVGRYSVYDEIASGGMATVHFGRLLGAEGFSRTVALKRLHPQYAKDPDFSEMLLDEARVAARIRHPNVVPTVDVVAHEGELFLVMEYVEGEALGRLVRRAREDRVEVPIPVACAIVLGVLHGLHAAHEATNERGEALDIIHRDVSPQNVLVGVDGTPRILDFGVARAVGRIHTTRDGQVKGKLGYMSPEQLQQRPVNRRTDIHAAGVVLWELLTGARLFDADVEGAILAQVIEHKIATPSTRAPAVSRALDDVVMQALAREPAERFGTARQMASALERASPVASATVVAEWVDEIAHDTIAARARVVAEIESGVRLLSTTLGPAAEATSATKSARRPRARTIALAASGVVVLGLAGVLVARAGRAPAPVSAEPGAKAAVPSPATPLDGPGETPSAAVTTIAHPPAPAGSVGPPTPGRRAKSAPLSLPASKPCGVKSFVDDAGVKHFYKDCGR